MTAFSRSAALVLSATVIAGAVPGTAGAASWFQPFGSSAQPQIAIPAASKKKPHVAAPLLDGTYQGKTYDAYYGLVQVQANVTGGQIVSVDVLQYPKDRRTSRYINSQALPMLQQEVVTAQGTAVDGVSGATLTSEAFVRSLQSALDQASN